MKAGVKFIKAVICPTTLMLRKCFTDGLADLKNLDTSLKERLSWSDTKLLRSILFFWTLVVGVDAQVKEAVEDIVSIFWEPLETKGTSPAE